jgi:hypothetical protein
MLWRPACSTFNGSRSNLCLALTKTQIILVASALSVLSDSSMQRTIKNRYVDYIDLHLVVRGELWQGDRMLFQSFCTHNPTTVNLDETECAVSTGQRLHLVDKRLNVVEPRISVVK